MAGAEIAITVDGTGHTLPITDWEGAPTNPCTFNDAAAKLARYAGPYLPASRIDQIVAQVASLESDADVATLAAFIRA